MKPKNIKSTTASHVWLSLPLAVAIAVLMAGCGGGGNAGSPNKTLTGELVNYQQSPIANAKVVYDSGSSDALTTTTGTGGIYKFVVPLSSISGHDTLTFYNSSGQLIDVASVTLPQDTIASNITTVAPPAPPAGI